MLIMMIIVLGCVAISQTSANNVSISTLPATSVSSSTIA